MLSKFISPGDKIEMQRVERLKGAGAEESRRVYLSSVHEIIAQDQMEVIMPMEKTKLILLPVDTEYDITIYGQTGLFQCFARVVDRYKSNNVYILALELTSNLRKHQRREYYRFSCALEMCSRNLEEEEIKAIDEKRPYVLTPGLPIKRSVIVDISGGGLRFLSTQKYEPDSMIYCSYYLLKKGEKKQIEVVGKVLTVNELENRKGTYEHRVQYVNVDVDTREQIIQFIFEEERKSRQRGKW